MNRRDIFKGLLAVPVVVYDVSRGTAKTKWEHKELVGPEVVMGDNVFDPDAYAQLQDKAPYDTDDQYYDEWLDMNE